MPQRQLNFNLQLAIAKRRKHYLRKRRFAEQFRIAGEDTLAQQLMDCQETEQLICCSSCRSSWWVLTKCRKRVCPLCSYEVAQERGRFMLALTRQMKYPKLVTLTMPLWTDEPRRGITHLRSCFLKLRHSPVFRKVRGGAYQIELKQKPGGWHIHMHMLIDAPFLPYQHLFSAWRSILGGVVPQVDIRSAQDEAARVYAAKYASKSAGFDMKPETIVAWYNATKGTRLFATFGEWYNVTMHELDPDTPLPLEATVCPACGAEKTVFRARDGPMLFGHDVWRDIEQVFMPGKEWTRDIESAEYILDSAEYAKTLIEKAEKANPKHKNEGKQQ